jgi:phosphohistidine phosphatase
MPRHLLVVRHGIAESRETFALSGRNDEHRPLTIDGRRRMKQGVAGLHTMVSDPGELWSSSLTRAVQTAELLSLEYDRPSHETYVLRPEARPEAWLDWFRGIRSNDVCIVGHNPHLSSLITWLLAGDFRPAVELKKGGVALLEFGEDGPAAAGGAVLNWMVTPAQLRTLGS